MATTTPNFGWSVPTSSDLVKNGAVAIETLGDSIDASLVDLKGGTTGQVLSKASNTDMDFTWATTAGGGGKVLQVVQATTSTQVTIASTTFTDSGLTCNITPSSATSKILVFTSQNYEVNRLNDSASGSIRLMRGATAVYSVGATYEGMGAYGSGNTAQTVQRTIASLAYLDSPATTSTLTYKTQGRVNDTGFSSTLYFQVNSNATSSIILMEIGA